MAKNPFPGMNPYLERHWGDVHASLVLYSRDQLNRQLRDPLRARVEERLVVENTNTEEERPIKPGVRVYKAPHLQNENGGVAVLASPTATLEPDMVELADADPETTTYLKIIDASTGGTLITVIEFLSPANKEPKGVRSADQYHAKREELRIGGVNLVEIDLLRGGERFFPEYRDRWGKCLSTPYAVCVRRAAHRSRYAIYSLKLRERLPAIQIPLRQQDLDVWLDLQALVDMVYENGRYDDIDYSRPLDPPLWGDDAGWANGLIGKSA